ncbi:MULTISPECIES: type II restriction endonuclease [Sphingomonadaceae]|uniref:site-specific DNA-methyltransferase (adenine-specific) n=3 Tax=Sphingomonadaceae TaxID=41297 RepID=A0A0S3F668_9SPHN|nr:MULTISPECIES: type II restriction endonuclease [Sphingomonadaceae]ALR23194.1 hypothetical protein ATN00_22115 [Sphingobium baderi]ETI59600.1 type II restriction endonuclease [Sphingobium sp. C100]MBB4050224.1 hypothetical protein [Sphingomonas zeae]NUU45513.1 restriction endonuclease [Sphingomonas zeae]PNU02806.1 hypothetical protein A8V01_25325 [Novosphingobium guangzhouense]
MTGPIPLEHSLLGPAERILDAACIRSKKPDAERRMQVLEAASARLGGYDLRSFHRTFGIDTHDYSTLDEVASKLLSAIRDTNIHPSLALSSLARERLSVHAQRTTGAHYTDFRLAGLIGRNIAVAGSPKLPLVDPASGTGILLVASVLALCNQDRRAAAKRLAEGVIAADQSSTALRGARLSLASLTGDLTVIKSMTARWHAGDSLMRSARQWRENIGAASAMVVGNPPWEKLKVHRHEEERATGSSRHYGAVHEGAISIATEQRKKEVRNYAQAVSERFGLASGEQDLFAAFTQLFLEISGPGGAISALLPAGLIRSKSTTALRKLLLDRFERIDIAVFDNSARFFGIDSRFKFLAVTGAGTAKLAGSRTAQLTLSRGLGSRGAAESGEPVSIPLSSLRRLRPDLSIPEVSSSAEWRLFARMSKAGQRWAEADDTWAPEFSREVDMTRERRLFKTKPTPGAIPLVEGRMVHQHRFGAKVYLSGTGRRAIWSSAPIGKATIKPQFWIKASDVPATARPRLSQVRAGFCDIAGQTNERSMLAAVIPAGVACGNKVPTILFPNALGEDALHLWCGMVNSIAFDWLLRRVLTTTVNYFLLQSVPLPPILPDSLPARRIVAAARRIAQADVSRGGDAAATIAAARRDIDLICLRAYGIRSDADVIRILDDFPSLDRSQPALPGEKRSTITRDFILSEISGSQQDIARQRVLAASTLGARAYVPSQVDADEPTTSQVAHGL